MRIGFKLLKFEKILFILFAFLAQNSLGNELLKIQEEDLVMGDLNAPITIIEYASLSCPHCASFHKNIYKKLCLEKRCQRILKFQILLNILQH